MRACRNIMALALTLGLMISSTLGVRAQQTETPSVGDSGIIVAENSAGEQPPLGASELEMTAGLNTVATPTGIPPAALTGEKFRELVSENEGGVVTLTGDVVWDDYWGDVVVEQPTTVLMGDYAIQIPQGTYFSAIGPLRFEGNGVQKPLFYIEGELFTAWTEINATGNDATALFAEGDLRLYQARITAGGVAVHATGSVLLQLCEVIAQGAAVVSETGNIGIDGCRVLPMPENATVIVREAVPGGRMQENGICANVGDSLEEAVIYDRVEYYLLDTERRESASIIYPSVSWENLPADTILPGEYSVICRPVGIPDWVPVPGIAAFEVPLHVVGENEPHIQLASRLASDGVYLQFFSEIVEMEAMTLWFSTDGGFSWRDFATLEGADILPFSAMADTLEANLVYLFRLEVTGGPLKGFSNTLVFPFYDSDPDREGDSGDRTGADRFPPGGTSNENDPGDETGNDGDNGNDDSDDGTPDDGTGTGGNGGTQPEDENSSGDSGNANRGGSPDNGTPGSETGTGNNGGAGSVDSNIPFAGNVTVNNPQAQEEEANSGITPAHTDSLFSTPVLATDIAAPAFASGDHTRQDGTATDGESSSAFADATAAPPATAEETNAARAQPPIPEPAFPLSMAMALTGSGVILLAGLSVWIKARRLRGR